MVAGRVCKAWYKLASDTMLWRRLFYQNAGWRIRTDRLADAAEARLACHADGVFVPSVHTHWKWLYIGRWELDRRWYSLQTRQGGTRARTAFRPAIHKLRGHTDSVYCCCIDPGVDTGRPDYVLSGSRDRTIRVWDTATMQCLSVLQGHTGSVLCLQQAQGLVVSGSSDGTARTWYASPRTPLGSDYTPGPVLRGHKAGVLDVAFDETYLVTASRDTTLCVWRRATCELVHTYRGHHGSVNACSIYRGTVASGAGDGSVCIWDLATGATHLAISAPYGGISSLVLDRDGLFTGSSDHAIRLWDTTSGACMATFSAHAKLVRAIAYDAARHLLVSGSWDRRTRLWDLAPLLERDTFHASPELTLELGMHQARIFDVCIDTHRLVSACEDHTLWVTDFGHQGLASWIYG